MSNENAVQYHTYSRVSENGRQAVVLRNKLGFYVNLYHNNEILERREVYKHSETYAENLAENWVDGLFSL